MTAPLVTSTLTHADLNALPAGSAVRCTTERGMRTVLALKLGGYGSDANKWLTTDGAMFPSSFAIAQANPVLLEPASPVSTDPTTNLDNDHTDVGLRAALTKLADEWPAQRQCDGVLALLSELRALFAAHPRPVLGKERIEAGCAFPTRAAKS